MNRSLAVFLCVLLGVVAVYAVDAHAEPMTAQGPVAPSLGEDSGAVSDATLPPSSGDDPGAHTLDNGGLQPAGETSDLNGGTDAQVQPPTETHITWPEPSSYMKLTGRVSRVKSGFVFVKTPVGTVTLYSQQGLRKAKRGQMVTVWTHDSNVVVDIFNKGDAAPVQRFLTGVPVITSSEPPELQFWTPDGGENVPLQEEGVRMAAVEDGQPITVQLDGSGEVVGQPDLNVDIQISDGTKKRQGTTLKLAGTVSNVRAGFVFVDTPIGPLTLSQKTGLRNAKVGQEVTVWLNEDHLVIDVRMKGEPAPARRFVTGRVVYTSEDKSQIKLWTPEGEKAISLPPGKRKRRTFREGTPITVQLNGSGEVIDVRKAR